MTEFECIERILCQLDDINNELERIRSKFGPEGSLGAEILDDHVGIYLTVGTINLNEFRAVLSSGGATFRMVAPDPLLEGGTPVV